MRKVLNVFLLLISLGWLSLAFRSVYKPFAPALKLFSYPEGIFSREIPADNISMEGTGYNASISFDQYGVPSIKGNSSKDVGFALGYMHARDRYFQMELITRTVQGQLSEVLGGLTLEKDIFWKPLDIDEKAKADFEKLSKENPAVYNYLLAYDAGVNYYLDHEKASERFFEYALLDAKPRKWENYYPLLVSYYMSKMLSYDESDLAWANNLGSMPSKIYDLFYSGKMNNYPYIYAQTFNTDSIAGNDIGKMAFNASPVKIDQEELEKNLSKGSNNWAVSAAKSKSGNSILCNDTHLDIMMPSPWYQVQISCPEFHVQGFTVPCAPYILTGNNEHIAWGITNGHWDEVDLFTLKFNADSTKCIVDGKEENIEVKEHSIRVKGEDDYVFSTKYTSHGIIKTTDSLMYAEKWYVLDFQSSIHAFDGLMKAKDWSGFGSALQSYTFPPQNFVYSDAKGNVGMISAGKLPLRNANYRGEMLDGSKPLKTEFIAFKNLPQYYSADTGFVCSANQLQAKTNYYINHYWTEPYRALRINEFLNKGQKLTTDDMKQLQTDKKDMSAVATLSVFSRLSAEDLSADEQHFLNPLKAWNGVMGTEMKEPVKYYYLKNAIENNMQHMLRDNYKLSWFPGYSNLLGALNADTIYYAGLNMPAKVVLKNALDTAITWFKKYTSEEVNYDAFSPFYLDHILKIPGAGREIAGKGGSSTTVDVNGSGVHGASMRTIIEFGPEMSVQTILAGGQSGRVNSIHYDDQVAPWKDGVYNTIVFDSKREGSNEGISFK